MSLNKWFLGAAALAAACTPSVEQDTPSDLGPVALFAPSAVPCAGVVPFPTDLAKNPSTGGLNIPICPEDDDQTIAVKQGLATLDGFALRTPIYAQFSEAIDPTTLTAETVALVNAGNLAFVEADFVFRANDQNDDPSDDNTLYFVPRAPLAERTSYAVIITDGVHGTDGEPVQSDVAFQLLKSETPLVDERGYSVSGAVPDDTANALEPLRAGFQPLFQGIELYGVPRENVALAWLFTTQTVHASYPQLAQLVSAQAPVVTRVGAVDAAEHPLLARLPDRANLGCVYTGRIEVTNLLTGSGTFGPGTGGMPFNERADLDYMLVTPASSACGSAWAADASRVVVFAHGLGRCKNDALALAGTFAQAGFATLSLDGPRAGSRSVESLGDQDLDGCPDQPAVPEFIALAGQSPNPFAIRDGMRQWGLELVQVANALASDAWAFAGVTKPDGGATATAVVGHSFGGMAAVLADSVTENIARLATNASSADFMAMFQPVIQASVAAALTAAGVDLSTPGGQALLASETASALSTYEWVLEPGDPLWAAGDASGLAQVVSGGEGEIDEPAFHQAETQTALVRALGNDPTNVTFTMTDAAGASVCDDSSGIVGAMLVPCSSAPEAMSQLVAMRTQLVTYLATGTLP